MHDAHDAHERAASFVLTQDIFTWVNAESVRSVRSGSRGVPHGTCTVITWGALEKIIKSPWGRYSTRGVDGPTGTLPRRRLVEVVVGSAFFRSETKE